MGGRQFMGLAFRFSSYIPQVKALSLLLPVLRCLRLITLFVTSACSFVANLRVKCASNAEFRSKGGGQASGSRNGISINRS